MLKSLNREVLRLAVPSILANITVPLVGIVDTAIAGHISDASAIGGIAIGAMLFDLLYWNFGFLRVGTAGMTAQAYGRGDGTTADILAQSLAVAIGGAILVLLLQWVFLTISLMLIPCSAEVSSFARDYFFIRIWASPATLSLLALRGWFIGMQSTAHTMAVDLTVNVVNMIASWLLAVCTPLGAIGVAWGTVVAQYTGLVIAVIILLSKYKTTLKRVFCIDLLREALSWQKMRRLFVLNGNLFVRSLCFMVVYVGFTSLASKFGDTELAVSSIMMRLFMLFSYFIDGFAYAGEALTGRFYGEHNALGMRQTVRILFYWTMGIGVVCTLLYAFAGDMMIRLMTNDSDIMVAARPYRIWLILMPVVSCLAFLWDGIFIGATAGAYLRNSMILAAVGFVAGYLLLESVCGMQALYIAYFVHLVARAAYLTVRYRSIQISDPS